MKHGKPAAVVIGVEGEDIEDVLLAHDPKFWALIRERRKQPTVSLEEAKRLWGLPPGPAARRRRPSKKRA
jgi:hypothetical protein